MSASLDRCMAEGLREALSSLLISVQETIKVSGGGDLIARRQLKTRTNAAAQLSRQTSGVAELPLIKYAFSE